MKKNEIIKKIIKIIKFGCLLALLFFTICSAQITPPLTAEEQKYSINNNLEYESDSVNEFIIYRAYVVKYDKKNHIPSFTIHNLLPKDFITEVKAKRRSTFYIDEYNLGNVSATNADYKLSGYDRGHMVPAVDFDSDQVLKDETFYLTNICPQSANLNRGIWKNLEDAIREKTAKYKCAGIIITGSIVDSINQETIGMNKVQVPSYYYKIIFYPDSLKMYAFLFSNHMDYYTGDIENYQVRVDDIELITHENFFDKLEANIQADLEAQKSKFR